MKKLMLSSAILMATAFAAGAQSAPGDLFRPAADPAEIRASNFIGMRVYAADAPVDATEYQGVQGNWSDIGEVNDVILSRDGKVSAVLVDIGGFLGVGERQVAVAMPQIRFVSDSATADKADDFFLVLNADRATLEGAPEFKWNEAANAPAATDGAIKPAADATMAENAAAARQPMTREGYAPLTADVLTTADLEGAKVYDQNDEWIGDVGKLVISDSGQITDAVVDVGGFLGIGAKPVSLKLDQIDILRSNDGKDLRVYLPMTKADLEAMPRFEG